MTTAYSYIRFSTPEQSKGDSHRRQQQKAKEYALQHNILLDENLTFRDLGRSAFRGGHAEVGKLGEFILAIDEGLVKPGDYLLIENLDRLSRQAITDAFDLLRAICNRGVNVVTFSDGKIYNRESLNDPINMLTAIILFSRSHEESATKGKRVKEAWDIKRKNIKNKPLTSKVPGWIEYDKAAGKLNLIDDRVKIVRRIFTEYIEGKGQTAISRGLNNDQVPCWGTGEQQAANWYDSYITKILDNEAVIGVFRPHVFDFSTGKKKRVPTGQMIPDYYPSVLDTETFYRVRELRDQRNTMKGRKATQQLQNIFSMVAKCPHCGGKLIRVNKGKRSTYLVCSFAKLGATVEAGHKYCSGGYQSIPLGKIESRFIDAVKSGQFFIPVDGSKISEIQEKIDKNNRDKQDRQTGLSKIVNAILEGSLTNKSVMHYDVPRADGTIKNWTVEDEREILEQGIKGIEIENRNNQSDLEVLRPRIIEKKLLELKHAVSRDVVNYEQANSVLRALCESIVIRRDEKTIIFKFNHTERLLILNW
ncbi:MAG: recombinase family protein [Desulfuromonadales bacterium]|nr:recombinase family protein [Desulfuromonadales bacterium]